MDKPKKAKRPQRPPGTKSKPPPKTESEPPPRTESELPPRTESELPLEATWTMFPFEHENVALLLAPSNLTFTFHDLDTDQGCIRNYDTNIMGSFRCRNKKCKSTGWGSKRIAITIRLFPNEQYNAMVWYQRCKKCDELSEPKIDGSYAERVVYRLKKWKGVEQEEATYDGNSSLPHVKSLCEGCKAGHCGGGMDGVDGLVQGLRGFQFGGFL